MADGLDKGDWYWLWLTGDDGNRVPAGTFRGTGDTVQVTLTPRCHSTRRAPHLGHDTTATRSSSTRTSRFPTSRLPDIA